MRVLTILGTRPEAIKLAPVIKLLRAMPGITHATCVTGQHRQMLEPVLTLFDIRPDFTLNIMKPDQSLSGLTAAVLDGLCPALDIFRPDWVVVQGDTTSAFAGALAAFYRKCRVAHVEAGLRTGNLASPWPEEANRRLIAPLASLHFPPTARAAENLRREGVEEGALLVTGNTVIDALQLVANRLEADPSLSHQTNRRFDFLNPSKRLILVTGHRRENLEGGLQRMCRVLAEVSRARDDVEFVYPVHLNPHVQQAARDALGNCGSVYLIEPLDYLAFVALMRRAYLVVTDSGGIQEEAPGLGKPVLITRETTERPEAIEAGTARLVGTSGEGLRAAMTELLDNTEAYRAMAQARNPFGDGQAARRIARRLAAHG